MPSRPPLLAGSVTALALLAAGCGGGSPGVASVGSSTNTAAAAQSGLVGYAACMRSHGLGTFPDPDATGGIPKKRVVAAAQGNPKGFREASTACAHLLPNSGLAAPVTTQQARTQLADKLSFARCMRSHGASGFPDPTAQGELSVEMVQAAGIDVHSPTFLRVVQKCLPASHGGLTAAKVREAIANAGR